MTSVVENTEVVKTPLQSLIEMNEQVRSTRRKSARPKDPTAKIEAFYNRQLRAILRKAAQQVVTEILPVIKQEKPNYVPDSGELVFKDGWAERIISKITQTLSSFTEGVLSGQAERLARSTVSMAESETTQAFLESVNGAVGVDLSNMIGQEGMEDYISSAVHQNVKLIKSIPEEYFEGVENTVLGGMRGGLAPSAISRQLQDQFGVAKRRAKFIARDQVSKLNTDITERRQTQAGIKYYRSVHSGDNRVTGKPGGKYPNAKIKCWNIAKRDIGYGPGVYRWDKGATYAGKKGLHPGRHHPGCRCTASPVFEWELPKKRK